METAPNRLSALDEAFLHLEGPSTPMHVGAVAILEAAPLRDARGYLDQDRIRRHVSARLPRVPRLRHKLAFVPFGQGRPLWVDDEHFNLDYHVRFSALPAPGGEVALQTFAGRLLSRPLDRNRPLWELDVVEIGDRDRVALVWKAHHCMVDGVAGMELAAQLFETDADAADPVESDTWIPSSPRSEAMKLLDAWIEKATRELEHERTLRAALREPRETVRVLDELVASLRSMVGQGLAPRTSLNRAIGPDRRFATSAVELARVKRIKSALGGTVNDVVLAAVASATRALLLARGEALDGVALRTLVPVSVRSGDESGALGNRVSALVVDLDVGERDPARRLAAVVSATTERKRAHDDVAARLLTNLSGAAPALVLQQAARMQPAQRFVNLVVTNVPGPQFPLYLAGARLRALHPCVPLAPNLALSVAILSYDGWLGFGLVGDWAGMPDLASMAEHLERAFADLERAIERPKRRAPKLSAKRAKRTRA